VSISAAKPTRITRNISDDLADGTFSLLEFYDFTVPKNHKTFTVYDAAKDPGLGSQAGTVVDGRQGRPGHHKWIRRLETKEHGTALADSCYGDPKPCSQSERDQRGGLLEDVRHAI
jgi:hypothetical protein